MFHPGKKYTVSISLKRVLRPTSLNYIQNISKIRKNAAKKKTPNHKPPPLIPNRRLVVKNDHPLLKTLQHLAGRRKEAYLADVMARLAELKLRFRLRMAIPILEAPWRKKLHSSLPVPQHLGGCGGLLVLWTLVDVGGLGV